MGGSGDDSETKHTAATVAIQHAFSNSNCRMTWVGGSGWSSGLPVSGMLKFKV